MAAHSSRRSVASLVLASLLLMGAPRAVADRGARTVPATPQAQAPTTARRAGRSHRAGTALDQVQTDHSADPISSVPDRHSLAADAAAERRRSRAVERARVRTQRARERARERALLMSVPPAAPVLMSVPRADRPRSHLPAPLQSSLDRAFTAPLTPRAREPLPAPEGAAVQLSRERPSATVPVEPLAAAAVAAAQAPVSVDHAIATLDAALTPAPEPVQESVVEDVVDPGVPTRQHIRSAVASVAAAIRACARNRSGHTIEVHTVFRRSGRVARAEVHAQVGHIEPRQRSCMARAARAARTPAFEAERFEVTYSLRL